MMQKIRDILAMPNDSIQKTVFVAITLCLVCSVVVSGAAVALKPQQEKNKALDKKRNILQIAGLMDPEKSIDELFEQIEARVVNLETGEYMDDIDAETFDARAASIDPAQNVVLSKEEDIASIKRHAKYATVYLVREDDQESLKKIILPVSGYGLWSTMHGFLAIAGDINTIIGLGFYEHAETPGLGGEIDNPNWKALWEGKQLFNEQGDAEIIVKKAASADSQYEVDAISGATLTSNGVHNLVRFWIGEGAFGPYLEKLSEGEA